MTHRSAENKGAKIKVSEDSYQFRMKSDKDLLPKVSMMLAGGSGKMCPQIGWTFLAGGGDGDGGNGWEIEIGALLGVVFSRGSVRYSPWVVYVLAVSVLAPCGVWCAMCKWNTW
jgi:hypothetical protein